MGADGGQDARRPHDTEQAEQADRDEPHQHHRPEDVADEFGSLALDQEQGDQDRDGDGNDHRRQPGRVDLETFDGAEHRDRRRDHAVAVEQRGSDQTDDEQGGAPAPARCVPGVEQREQCHDAALAVIVGAQDQDGVFERDDEEERPEDQRHDAHHGFGRGRPARRRRPASAHRVCWCRYRRRQCRVRPAPRRRAASARREGATPWFECLAIRASFLLLRNSARI